MKAIKAFTPYNLSTEALHVWCGKAAKSDKTAEVIRFFLAKDPASHSWNSVGLVAPIDEGRIVHNLDGAAHLLCYQFNDRILPGTVRDEKFTVLINAIKEKEGREVTSKEWAQTRDEVEAELLPQAFIRRAYVPVLVYKERIFICTTSAKKCETIVNHLNSLMKVRKIECEIWNIWTESEIGATMKSAIFDDVFDDDGYLTASDAAVFKGADKRTMRIKDRALSHKDVQQALLEGSYSVTELRLDWLTEDGEDLASFTLTDKLIFKGIKLVDSAELQTAEDTHATMFIFAKQLAAFYADTINGLGGESDEPPVVKPAEEEEL